MSNTIKTLLFQSTWLGKRANLTTHLNFKTNRNDWSRPPCHHKLKKKSYERKHLLELMKVGSLEGLFLKISTTYSRPLQHLSLHITSPFFLRRIQEGRSMFNADSQQARVYKKKRQMNGYLREQKRTICKRSWHGWRLIGRKSRNNPHPCSTLGTRSFAEANRNEASAENDT